MKMTIKAARALRGLTQKQLAKKIGKSEFTIANWESGKTVPKMDDFDALCEVLEISRGELVLTSNQV